MTAMSPAELVDRRIDELLSKFPDPPTADPVELLGVQYDLGLAWVHFDEGAGGLAVDADLQRHVDARLADAGAPQTLGDFIAVYQVAAILHRLGTPEELRLLR